MLTKKQDELAELMAGISERCYCAGWINGNEFRLWSAVIDPVDTLSYGLAFINREEVEEMKRLSQEIDGWIVWQDANLSSPSDLCFIEMSLWLEKYSQRFEIY